MLRLVQWELVVPSIELVTAILQPVRPRDQHLTPARRAHLVGTVSIDKLSAAGGVGAKPTTNLDDHRPLIRGCDRYLLARWRYQHSLPSSHLLVGRACQKREGPS